MGVDARDQRALEIGESVIGLGLTFKVLDTVLPERGLVLGKTFGTIGLVKELPSPAGERLGLVSFLSVAEEPRDQGGDPNSLWFYFSQ